MGTTDTQAILITLGALLIIGGLVAIYILFIKHNAPFAHTNKFGRHINFDHYHTDTIVKLLYFVALAFNTLVALSLIFGGFAMFGQGEADTAFAIILVGVLFFVVFQGLARLCHEFIIIYVHMAEDVRGIRDGFGYDRVKSRAKQPAAAPRQGFAAQQQPAAMPRQSAAPRPAPAPQPVPAPNPAAEKTTVSQPVSPAGQDRWTCTSCGTLVNGGKFCSKCGSMRA